MTIRSQLFSFGAAALLAMMITVPASAAPISGGMLKDVTAADRQIDAVHYRDWRHCHWRGGYRYCHGGYDYDYGYDYPYYYGYPGYSVFRFGHRHHRHHGHHGHHGRHGHHGGHRGGHGGRR